MNRSSSRNGGNVSASQPTRRPGQSIAVYVDRANSDVERRPSRYERLHNAIE